MLYYLLLVINSIMGWKQPHMAPKDKILFYKYLDKASVYFEYGSGGSTYVASLKPNLKQIYSVESDLKFLNTLNKLIEDGTKDMSVTPTLSWLYIELGTKYGDWGQPHKNCPEHQKISYSSQLGNLKKTEREKIDLILIDGRFRAASCLKCFQYIKDDCVIMFDDFLNRTQCYGVVLDYYDIIEKTEDNRLVVLKKKPNIQKIPLEIIKKYELEKS